MRRYLSGKRCLLLLDNVDDDQPGKLVPEGRAAVVVVTARNGTIPFLAEYPELIPKLFTDAEASGAILHGPRSPEEIPEFEELSSSLQSELGPEVPLVNYGCGSTTGSAVGRVEIRP